MARRTAHTIGCCILLLWGTVFIYFYGSGRVIHYLQEDGWFRPMVLWGGISMVGLGLFNAIACQPPPGETGVHSCSGCGPEDPGAIGPLPLGDALGEHVKSLEADRLSRVDSMIFSSKIHRPQGVEGGEALSWKDESLYGDELRPQWGMIEWFQLGILAVPIAIAAMFSPDQFSLHALENKGLYEGETNQTGRLRDSLTGLNGGRAVGGKSLDGRGDYIVIDEQNLGRSFKLSDLEATVPRSQEGDFQLSLAELYLIAGDPDMASVVDGQPVETLGRVVPEKGDTEGGRRLRLFRIEVMCCAADARPYSIAVGLEETPPPLKSMAWVKVRGIIRYLPRERKWLPRLDARSIQPTAAPLENPF